MLIAAKLIRSTNNFIVNLLKPRIPQEEELISKAFEKRIR